MDRTPAVSVILPTYRRHDYLPDSLGDLLQQELGEPYEVVVVRRADDPRTEDIALAAARSSPTVPLRVVTVEEPGIVRAMREGWRTALGSIVAFSDDDARYPSEWLRRLSLLFADPSVGAAGDAINRSEGAPRVGWFGRTFARSCRETVPCDAHFLSGANMAFRLGILHPDDIDPRLDGPRSPGIELLLCFRVRHRGFRVLFDPRLSITHLAGPWMSVPRGASPARTRAYSRNTAFIMLSELPRISRIAFRLYFRLVVQRESPGLVVAGLGTAPPCATSTLVRHRDEGKARGRPDGTRRKTTSPVGRA